MSQRKANTKKVVVTILLVIAGIYLVLYFMDMRWIHHITKEEQDLLKRRNHLIYNERILKEEGFIKPSNSESQLELWKRSYEEAMRVPGYAELSEDEKNAVFLSKTLQNSGVTTGRSEHDQRAQILKKIRKYRLESDADNRE